jgi:hypothetical protein
MIIASCDRVTPVNIKKEKVKSEILITAPDK